MTFTILSSALLPFLVIIIHYVRINKLCCSLVTHEMNLQQIIYWVLYTENSVLVFTSKFARDKEQQALLRIK